MTNFFGMWATEMPLLMQKRDSCPRGCQTTLWHGACSPAWGRTDGQMSAFQLGERAGRGTGRGPQPTAAKASDGGVRAGIEVIPREGETRGGGCRSTGRRSVRSCRRALCLITAGGPVPPAPRGSATRGRARRGCRWLQHVLRTRTWGFTTRSHL